MDNENTKTSKEMLDEIVNQTSDEDKIKLIDKYAEEMDESYFSEAIASIKDFDLLCKIIDKYIYDIDFYIMFKSIKNDEEKIKLITAFEDVMPDSDLSNAIETIEEFNLLNQMINKYVKRKLNFADIIISRVDYEEKIILITKHAEHMDKGDLTSAIVSIKDFDLLKSMVEKYIDRINFGILNSKFNDDQIIELARLLLPVYKNKLIKEEMIGTYDYYLRGLIAKDKYESFINEVEAAYDEMDKEDSEELKNGKDNNGSEELSDDEEEEEEIEEDIEKPKKKFKDIKKIVIASISAIAILATTTIVLVKKAVSSKDKTFDTSSSISTSSNEYEVITDDSSLKDSIEKEVASLVDSKVDESSKLDDSSLSDDTSIDDSKEESKVEEESSIEESIEEKESSIADESSQKENDNNDYFVAPDGTYWETEDDYLRYIGEQGKDNNYFVAPDGSYWSTEDDYNRFMESLNNPKEAIPDATDDYSTDGYTYINDNGEVEVWPSYEAFVEHHQNGNVK